MIPISQFFKANIENHTLPVRWLSLYRIGFSFYALFIMGVPNFSWLNNVSGILFDPPISIAALFSDFPSDWILMILSGILVILFCMLMIGYNTIYVSVFITVILIVCNSFKYSLGKIDHDILFVICPAVMAFSGWGEHYSYDATTHSSRKFRLPVIPTIAIILAFGMLTSALTKIWNGWLSWDIFAIKEIIIRSHYLFERSSNISLFLIGIKSQVFWKIMDYIILLIEGATILTVFWRRIFSLNIYLLLLFHLCNSIILQIPFYNLFPVYILFFDWHRIRQIGFVSSAISFFRKMGTKSIALAVSTVALVQWIVAVKFYQLPILDKPTFLKGLIYYLNGNVNAILGILIYGVSLIGIIFIYISRKKEQSKLI